MKPELIWKIPCNVPLIRRPSPQVRGIENPHLESSRMPPPWEELEAEWSRVHQLSVVMGGQAQNRRTRRGREEGGSHVESEANCHDRFQADGLVVDRPVFESSRTGPLQRNNAWRSAPRASLVSFAKYIFMPALFVLSLVASSDNGRLTTPCNVTRMNDTTYWYLQGSRIRSPHAAINIARLPAIERPAVIL